MNKANVLLALVLVVAVAFGLALLLGALPSQSSASAVAPVEVKSHWRHHDGHWSYWDVGDKRWYYTDGANWYYNDGDAWSVYRFDKGFGKEGFERGEYKVPGEGVKIELPRHKIFIER
jgi:hypothetical protein